MNLIEFYNSLNSIIIYLCGGYVFLRVFSYATSDTEEDAFDVGIFKSLIVGFVLKAMICVLPIRFGKYINILGYLVFCVGMAYGCGRLTYCETIYKILGFFRITKSPRNNIWDELKDPNHSLWATVYLDKYGVYYQGVVRLYDETQKRPQVILSKYKKFKSGIDAPVEDFSGDSTKRVLIDTCDAPRIEFSYHEDSKVITRF